MSIVVFVSARYGLAKTTVEDVVKQSGEVERWTIVWEKIKPL